MDLHHLYESSHLTDLIYRIWYNLRMRRTQRVVVLIVHVAGSVGTSR